MSNNIDSIFSFGADALANMYEVAVVVLPEDLKKNTKLDLASSGRIQSINIPGISVESYDRHYKTQVISIPNGKIAQSKEFSFSLRIDKNFEFYELLTAWGNLANSAGKLMWLGDQNHYLGEIIVKRCGNNLKIVETGKNTGWHFHGVWIKSIADISFEWSSGDPLEVEVTCSYSYWENISSDKIQTSATAPSSSPNTFDERPV